MAPHTARMMLRTARHCLAVCLALLWTGAHTPCRAQAPRAETMYTNQTRFWIPFDVGGPAQRLREVRLYWSSDQGRTWRFAERALPHQRGFQFNAERDGVYAFTVQTVDIENKAHPPTVEGAQPGLMVCVDSQPPAIRLAPLSPQDGAGVEWDIRDDNLDLTTLRLEYRAPGGMAWQPIQVNPVASGRHTWQAGAPVDELRMLVRDRAGNQGEAVTSLSGRKVDNRAFSHDPTPGGANRPAISLVNSNRISINYKVEDIGPSKATLEMWWTRNQGRTWEECQKNLPTQGPCIVPAPQEGLYGFTLVARSGVNLGDRPPQAGDQPQIWVEVDLTEPQVRLTSVEVGRGLDANKMTIRWVATDKNLEERPIKLEYAPVAQENATEPTSGWQEIAAQLPADGQYVWTVPSDGVRYFVRAVARDRAGNVGQARTPKPIIVDLSKPRGIILGVEPARGEGGAAAPGDSRSSITIPSRGG